MKIFCWGAFTVVLSRLPLKFGRAFVAVVVCLFVFQVVGLVTLSDSLDVTEIAGPFVFPSFLSRSIYSFAKLQHFKIKADPKDVKNDTLNGMAAVGFEPTPSK